MSEGLFSVAALLVLLVILPAMLVSCSKGYGSTNPEPRCS